MPDILSGRAGRKASFLPLSVRLNFNEYASKHTGICQG